MRGGRMVGGWKSNIYQVDYSCPQILRCGVMMPSSVLCVRVFLPQFHVINAVSVWVAADCSGIRGHGLQ